MSTITDIAGAKAYIKALVKDFDGVVVVSDLAILADIKSDIIIDTIIEDENENELGFYFNDYEGDDVTNVVSETDLIRIAQMLQDEFEDEYIEDEA